MEVTTQIEQAVHLLKAGELVAIPTETVYGLGADASNPTAVAKIFAAKGRPADHPLIVHLASSDALDAWARDIPPLARQLAARFWPGPLTLILKRQPQVSDSVTGGQDTVGLRVPNHPLTLALLQAFGGGVAAPSANRFGRISPTTAAHVRSELGEEKDSAVSLILDGGACTVGIESTIVDLSRGVPVILRPGAITATDIAGVAGMSKTSANPSEAAATPRVSGSLAAHYAPQTKLRLLELAALDSVAKAALGAGQRVAVLARSSATQSNAQLLWQQAPSDAAAYARDLYANLRLLDAAGVDLILVEAPPSDAAWLAVADRLGRAATGSGEISTS